MVLSRLLQAKSPYRYLGKGLPKSARWCSTASNGGNEKSSQSKTAGAAKKYKEMDPRVFPKATQVQNKAGGSWYILSDIVTRLKEKILEYSPLQNHTSDTSCPDKSEINEPENSVINSHCNKNISTSATSEDAINAKASEATRRHSTLDNSEHCKPKNIVQSSKAATSCIEGECISVDLISTTASDVIKMQNSPCATEVTEAACIVQLSETVADSHSIVEEILTSAESSNISQENHSEDIVRSDEVSDSSKQVEPMEAHSGALASFGKDRNSQSDQLSCLDLHPLNESTWKPQNIDANESFSSGSGKHQAENKMTISSLTSNIGSEMSETQASFSGAQKVRRMVDIFARTTKDHATREMTNKKSKILTSNGNAGHSNDMTGEDEVKSPDIMGLINCIKKMPKVDSSIRPQDNVISSNNDIVSNRSLIKGIQSQGKLQKIDNKGKRALFDGHAFGKKSEEGPDVEVDFKILHSGSKSEDVEESDADVASFDCKFKSTPQVPLPASKEDMNQTWDTLYAEERSNENKVLVNFLHRTAKKNDIVAAFKNCGEIMGIEFSYVRGSLFKMAYITFKTRKGLQKAIEKTDLMVKNSLVTVEAISSLAEMPSRISIPNLINDPDVPAALVKNPTRTVMIKHLTHDISSHQIEEALAFCESKITGFFLGSSSSVACVEFETEDAKERALAKHSIVLLGKQLFIFRIDAPITTVVRISNLNLPEASKKVNSICKAYGQVKCVVHRSADTIDVHFRLAEWPNMVKILNRLNGSRIDGQQLLARPATVVPPEILCMLWNQPGARRHVKAMVNSLVEKLGENAVHKAGLTDLAARFYGDEL
ncbi:uncharacterized protein LOC132296876 [Cornus florida]|uniref:uncharacterized protein LOC132296876 n=1 Tax=Cornus florida TaxID=4283 RepID=UPI0028A0034B|nr:uncharacterized protein LOC132296876 [Cornus florida]